MKEDKSVICLLINSTGYEVKKIFSESLAKKWKLNIVFTGTHKECLDNWKNYD